MAKTKNRAYCDPCVQADNYIHTPLGKFETQIMKHPRPIANCAGETRHGHSCMSLRIANG